MSRIYDKSHDGSYIRKAAYANQSAFEMELSKYNLATSAIDKSDAVRRHRDGAVPFNRYWGGVPMSFNADEKSVFVDPSDSHMLVIGSTGSKKAGYLQCPL